GPRYTRNGHFTLDQNGQLVTSDGYPVLDRQGQPIRFTSADTKIEISGDGTVATNLGPKAQINIVTFPDEQQLHKQSSTLYSTDQPAQPALKAQVVQGMIEDSNVQPIVEMTDMIKALRSYQAAQQLIEGNDSLMRNAITTWTEQPQAA
ncbi:MAG: flagellar basal body rod C-terminal domain-containing protein, partial [Trebonia sp.]